MKSDDIIDNILNNFKIYVSLIFISLLVIALYPLVTILILDSIIEENWNNVLVYSMFPTGIFVIGIVSLLWYVKDEIKKKKDPKK